MTTLYITALADRTFRIFDTMTMAILYGISTGQGYKVLVTRDSPVADTACFCEMPADPDGPRVGALWEARGVDFSSLAE